MGLFTDPIADIDDAREALDAAGRALDSAVGSPEFKNYGAACDALDKIDDAMKLLAAYPTFQEAR